jgi:type VI secretion system secreted protein Hcp
MAVDMFIWFEGNPQIPVNGETQDQVFKTNKAIEIRDLSLGFENRSTIGSATTGAGAGKATFENVVIKKRVDSTSGPLFRAMCVGGHFPKATIAIRKSGAAAAAGRPYLLYHLRLVFPTKRTVSAGDEGPEETWELAYGAVAEEWVPQSVDGRLDLTNKKITSWSRLTNTDKIDSPPM